MRWKTLFLGAAFAACTAGSAGTRPAIERGAVTAADVLDSGATAVAFITLAVRAGAVRAVETLSPGTYWESGSSLILERAGALVCVTKFAFF